MQYYKIVEWKLRLMKKLNDGILNTEEWQRFIAAAKANNFDAIADDMSKRYQHYSRGAGEPINPCKICGLLCLHGKLYGLPRKTRKMCQIFGSERK
jgi:hypothetical protein